MNPKLLERRDKELQNLDVLTEIFFFFTPITTKYARLACKWWNDLISKDNLIVSQVSKNNDGKEALAELHKDVEAYQRIFKEFLRLKEKIPTLLSRVDGASVRTGEGKKKMKEIDANLLDAKDRTDFYELYHPTLFHIHVKQKGDLIVKYIRNEKILIYKYSHRMSIDSDYIRNLIVVFNDGWLNIRHDLENSIPEGEIFILDSKRIKFGDPELKEILLESRTKIKPSSYLTYTDMMMEWLKRGGFNEGFDFVFHKDPEYVVPIRNPTIYENQPIIIGNTGYPG